MQKRGVSLQCKKEASKWGDPARSENGKSFLGLIMSRLAGLPIACTVIKKN